MTAKKRKSLDARIEAMELYVCDDRPDIRGTIIQRVMLDNKLFESCGLDPKTATGRESTLVWCIGLGSSFGPKFFSYGHTIEEAVTAAEKSLPKKR